MRNRRINLCLVFNKLADTKAARDAIDANMGLPKPDIRRQRMTRLQMRDDDSKTTKTWAKVRQRNTDGKHYFRKAPTEAMDGITPMQYNYTEEEFDHLWTFVPDEQ